MYFYVIKNIYVIIIYKQKNKQSTYQKGLKIAFLFH